VIMKARADHTEHELSDSLNDFFPHKVCINLDRRTDRWERMRARFAQHNIGPVTRFSALDGATLTSPAHWNDFPGAYGCLRSHMAVIEQAREQRMPSVLIFEDDVVFDPGLNARFADHIRQLPSDWDMVYFGGIHGAPPIRISDHVVKITHSLSTFAYALRESIYDGFLELNEKALTVLDENTRELQKYFNCYCFMPHLAWVEEDHSDVRDETEILWWIKESLVLWGDEMDSILRNTAIIISHHNTGLKAARNLDFIVSYYSRWLPDVTLLIVEQGERPSVNSSALPPQCRYEFLKRDGKLNRSRAFNLGFEMFESSKEFFIFADSDIFLTREDMKANLMQCRRYDFVSAFRNLWDLPEEETRRILNNEIRWNAKTGYHQKEKTDFRDLCCIITRAGMRAIGGWEEKDDVSAKINQSLRVFQSPNRARRLCNV
jgi:glycosyl transferase, family 25